MAKLTGEQTSDMQKDLDTVDELLAELDVALNSGNDSSDLLNTVEDLETAVTRIKQRLEDING